MGAVARLDVVLDTDLRPQRAKYVRERSEPEHHVLEPEWGGTRAIVRVGHPSPHFLGYSGPVEGSRELFDAISADARCDTAVIDGVLVDSWEDERDLEVDATGSAYVRPNAPRQIFAAFDLLEVDGQPLLDVPLLERKRHLEGVLQPSHNVRLTAYVTRGLKAWRDTLLEQGFKRVVLKDWNSAYSPGRTTDSWLVVEKLRDAGRR